MIYLRQFLTAIAIFFGTFQIILVLASIYALLRDLLYGQEEIDKLKERVRVYNGGNGTW